VAPLEFRRASRVAAPGEDAAASMMRTMFEQALRDAIADEDPEGTAMFDAERPDPAAFDAMVAAMMRGEVGAIMTPLTTSRRPSAGS
jgi:hypothetical protein